jgi:hypothetical protein
MGLLCGQFLLRAQTWLIEDLVEETFEMFILPGTLIFAFK